MGSFISPLSVADVSRKPDFVDLKIENLQKAIALKPFTAFQALGETGQGKSLIPSSSAPSLMTVAKTLKPLNSSPIHSDAEIKKASQNFEGIFLRMLFKEMRNSVEKSNFLGHSQAMEFFEEMQDEQLSDRLASAGGLGIGNLIYQQLKSALLPHQKTYS